MAMQVIEIPEFYSEAICNLRGRLEAAMASEAVGGSMCMNTRVIKIADFKSEVIGPQRSFGGRHGL